MDRLELSPLKGGPLPPWTGSDPYEPIIHEQTVVTEPYSPPSPLLTQSEEDALNLDALAAQDQTPLPPTQSDPDEAAKTPPVEQKLKKLHSPIKAPKVEPPKKSIHDRVGTRNRVEDTPETSINDRPGPRPGSTKNDEETKSRQRYTPPTFRSGSSQFTVWECDQDRYVFPNEEDNPR